MNLEDMNDISRGGAKFAISCVIGIGIGLPICILVSVPIGLLSGLATLTFSSILLQDDIEH